MGDSTRIPALVGYLAQIPEYRQARGKRHPLLALLLLVCVAMPTGARGQSAIADWGRCHGQPQLRRLGFSWCRGPSQPTLSRLFRAVPRAAVEGALRLCPPPVGALEGVAVDGKALRGGRRRGAEDAHLLAALGHRLGVTPGQVGVPDKTNEVGAVCDLLRGLPPGGGVVTADALLTQRPPARIILATGGDYLLAVKATFAPAVDNTGLVGAACTVDARGDRVECRALTASTALVGYSDWPGLRQALRVERRVIHKMTGRLLRQETAYAVTSLSPDRATPAQLLALLRGRQAIENRLHHVRDVAFREDRSQVRTGTAPQCMAAFRNAAVGLLRRLGATSIASACRRCAARPALALAAAGLPL